MTAMTGCQTCGGYGMKHDLAAHIDNGEDVRVTYAEGVGGDEPRTEWVADVKDAATGGAFSVHRCSECRALVESDHAADHLHWHRAQRPDVAPARAERHRVVGELRDFADDLYGITGARWIADALTSLDRLSEEDK